MVKSICYKSVNILEIFGLTILQEYGITFQIRQLI
nr:MAG TPA: hypothetical protein [Caudoviricetes sp.]